MNLILASLMKRHLSAPGFVAGKASQVHKAELVKDCCLKATPCNRQNNSVFFKAGILRSDFYSPIVSLVLWHFVVPFTFECFQFNWCFGVFFIFEIISVQFLILNIGFVCLEIIMNCTADVP